MLVVTGRLDSASDKKPISKTVISGPQIVLFKV